VIRRRRPASVSFAGFRFPPDVVSLAVRWYLRFGLSYRDVEELLAERGVEVDHVTIYRWVQRFTPLVVEAASGRSAITNGAAAGCSQCEKPIKGWSTPHRAGVVIRRSAMT
jgi:transposase-like protein